ncbi:DNA circulation family protein [Paraburkholderia sp. Ac-20340]|uniref:DNA circularization protein n=1 Tax=Paraburkholderia sp. Ac-20340 TaxID=2703888 RepID=UPI0019805C48|nr:DNA circularization N-terminal domain-containing protein [Paraburkholderia sp. Ac-20340]MBN3852012.1 DNA circulation family protein [Paraburkholderia sp. Ac-20340]
MSVASLTNLAGSIGGVASATSQLASLLTGASANSWWGSLRQASYGGVPFAVVSTSTRFGTRNAVHEYPFRDDAWIETLGKLPRRFQIFGFLIENSRVYGGGAVIVQRDRLVDVCEGGNQTLVHPTFGRIDNVACLDAEAGESVEHGRVIVVRFTFMRNGVQSQTSSTTDTKSLLDEVADDLGVGAELDFVKSAASAIEEGAAVVQTAVGVAVSWVQLGVSVVNDVRRFANTASTLVGNFGRFFGAGNSGYSGSNQTASSSTTAADLLNNDATARAAVSQASTALQKAAANPSDAASLNTAAQAYVVALAATMSGPSDAIRSLINLSSFTPTGTFTDSAIGTAMSTTSTATSALLRRAAIAQLAQTVAIYQPSSYDDAVSMMSTVTSLLDDEIEIAGDASDDNSYTALRSMRSAVVADLQARAADLASLATMSFGTTLPALVLAHRIYGDASRADQLVQQIAPVHPLFMPSTFQALAE